MSQELTLRDGSCFPVGLIVFVPGKKPGDIRMASTSLDVLAWPPAGRPAGKAFYAGLARRFGTWKKVLDEELARERAKHVRRGPVFLRVGLVQSGRRQYVVKGALLTRRGAASGRAQEQSDVYLLAIERTAPEHGNIPQVSREWKLSRREQMLVYFLSQDMTNKEIAHELKLSLNTVKVYMKNLMKKLGVRTRAAILPMLLFARRPIALGPRPPEALIDRAKKRGAG
jgi:DNA-binding CsgD family transcriptional regulator